MISSPIFAGTTVSFANVGRVMTLEASLQGDLPNLNSRVTIAPETKPQYLRQSSNPAFQRDIEQPQSGDSYYAVVGTRDTTTSLHVVTENVRTSSPCS